MSSIQKSIRLPEEAVKDIKRLAENSGKDFSGLARDLLMEAIKMRKCPGITFTDGPAGRRARIAGSGIDVWELIATFRGLKENYEKLKKAYHWLNDHQIRSAFSYYTLYPEELNEMINRNETMTRDEVLKNFPFLGNPGTGW